MLVDVLVLLLLLLVLLLILGVRLVAACRITSSSGSLRVWWGVRIVKSFCSVLIGSCLLRGSKLDRRGGSRRGDGGRWIRDGTATSFSVSVKTERAIRCGGTHERSSPPVLLSSVVCSMYRRRRVENVGISAP